MDLFLQILFAVIVCIAGTIAIGLLPQSFKASCSRIFTTTEQRLTGWAGAVLGLLILIAAAIGASFVLAVAYAVFLWATA